MKIASDISFLWIILWFIVCCFVSFWYYKNISWLQQQSRWIQFLMKGLRAFILFLIGVLLLNLIVENTKYRDEKPVLITLVDNSSSTKNYKDSSNVFEQTQQYISKLKAKFADQFEFVEMTTGEDVKYQSEFKFNEHQSNLYQGFEKIHEDFYNRNVGAVVFVSDGNFNEGNHPAYAAEKIALTPIYSLMIGDTIVKKDQLIKNIAVNDVAFLKNKFPVEIDVVGNKMNKKNVQVSILHQGKTISKQMLQYNDNSQDFKHLSFELEANQIGIQAYTVVLSDVDNEFNYQNNKRTFYLEVIDSRSKVLLLSAAPHPDLSAIKQELEKDENLEVKSFLINEWNKDLKKVDFVVLHNPGFQMNINQIKGIMDLKIPVLFVVGPNTDANFMKELQLGVNIPVSKQIDLNQAGLNQGFALFEVSEKLSKGLQLYPPLKSKFGELKVNGAEILAFQNIGGINKKSPLLFFTQKNNTKYGFFYGEGLWQWRLQEFAQTGASDGFNELISKTAQYLIVKNNHTNLRVSLPKRFMKNEDVIINASFYNESMEAITNPTIELELKNDKNKLTKYQFATQGKSYQLNIGTIAPGKYEWKAFTKFQGKYHQKNGFFIVEDVNIENLDNHSNYQVLNQIAKNSNAKVFELKSYEKLLQELSNRGDITSISYKESSFDGLIDFKFLFFLLVFLLSLEWFLRRWLGAY